MQLLLAVHHICSSGFWCVCVPSLCAGNKKNRTMPHCITLNPLILELHFSSHADVVSRSSRCCWCTTEPGSLGRPENSLVVDVQLIGSNPLNQLMRYLKGFCSVEFVEAVNVAMFVCFSPVSFVLTSSYSARFCSCDDVWS